MASSIIQRKADAVMAVVENVDMTAIAVTPLYTVPAGKRLTRPVMLFVPTAVDTLTGNSDFNWGFTAADYDDWLNATSEAISLITEHQEFTPSGSAIAYAPAGSVPSLNITTGAIAVVFTCDVVLMGLLVDA